MLASCGQFRPKGERRIKTLLQEGRKENRRFTYCLKLTPEVQRNETGAGMTALQLEDITLVGFVSLLAAWQLAGFARRVGKYRMQHKIPYPNMTGDEGFMRILRAQQNSLEFTPIFFVPLWMAAIFFHQVPAAVLGLVYIYSRFSYFNGYAKDTQNRLPGFRLGVRCIMFLLVLALIGIASLLVRRYTGIDLKLLAVDKVSPFFPAIKQLV